VLLTGPKRPGEVALTPEELALKDFDQCGNSLELWAECGWRLLLAASAVEKMLSPDKSFEFVECCETALYVHLIGPLLMLRAFAMECYLKALYLAQGRTLGRKGNLDLPGELKKHRLVGMAKAVGIGATGEEELMLDQLGKYVERGRYPVMQTHWAKLSPRNSDGTRRRTTVWSLEDEQHFWGFIRLLRLWTATKPYQGPRP